MDSKPLNAIGQVIESIGMDDTERDRKPICCRRCSIQIQDRFVLKIGKYSYHETCASCSHCDMALEGRCFEKHGDLFCENHYYKEWSAFRCAGCNEGVSPKELIYKLTNGMIFHVACHRCTICMRSLSPGERICVDAASRTVSCIEHFNDGSMDMMDTEMLPLQVQDHCGPSCSDTSNTNEQTPSECRLPTYMPIDYSNIKQEFPLYLSALESYSEYDDENKLKRRGPRTTIKQNQLDVLNRIFSSTPKPSKHARAKLALETGLSMRVIQVWFQNRRSKERRLKHLCNYLRHYEQRSLCMSGRGMPPGLPGFTPIDGTDPTGGIHMIDPEKMNDSSFFADLELNGFDDDDDDESN